MKKIGFVDYYISEWHANNYPKWICEVSREMGEDYVVSYSFAERDISPVDGVSTDEWCERMGVSRCKSIEELCEVSDYICILAPSNPEKHIEYCRAAFPSGKRIYVDKTFAPDCETAREIFALAQKHGASIFSTSALRYATELSELGESESIIVSGSGSNFDEYFIHIAEIAVKLMGSDVSAVTACPQGREQCTVSVELASGKRATLVFSPSMPYAVCAELADGGSDYKKIESKYFMGLIADMLNFFGTGEVSFDPAETLAVMKLREAAMLSRAEGGKRIEL